MTKNWRNQEEEVLQHLEVITLHQAAKSKRKRRSGDGGGGGGMFGLSGDDAGQVVVEEEEEEEEERRKLGWAGRNSHEVLLDAFATPELFKGPVGDGGGYPVESSLLMQQQGSIAAATSSMVDSSSELTTEGNVCGIGSAGAASSDGSLELRVGASTTLMDMLPGQTIIAAHESQQLSGLSPEVSPTVSGSSASTASGQNSGRVFSQLHLTGLDEKAFVSQESSSVRAPTDSIGSSHAAAPYLGVKSSCALTGISGPAPAAVAAPTLFRFSGSQAVCEEPNNIMMTAPDHMTAMLLRASFPSNCAAGDSSVEISGRPKRRNVRISKDPQSVAARHRRERISDRIRMLQRLVPGGTKMDTASMLDEAIHYVKFLKLQLQALEQLGSSFDPTFTMGMPAFQPCTSQPDSHPNGGTWRPFDLNSATYNQLAAAAAAASSPSSADASSNSGSSSHITGWPRASSSMCFPDHAQEQFCH